MSSYLWLPSNHFIPTDVIFPNSFKFTLKCNVPTLTGFKKWIFSTISFSHPWKNHKLLLVTLPNLSGCVPPHIQFCYSTFDHIFLPSAQILLTLLLPLSLLIPSQGAQRVSLHSISWDWKHLQLLGRSSGLEVVFGATSDTSIASPCLPSKSSLHFFRGNDVLIVRRSALFILLLYSIFWSIWLVQIHMGGLVSEFSHHLFQGLSKKLHSE